MNKYLIAALIFISGFVSHKVLQTVYSYSFWKTELMCREVDYAELDKCMLPKMGLAQYLPYLTVIPVYTDQQWRLSY